MAVGCAAYLVSKAIKKSRVVAFEELGMEAIYEFERIAPQVENAEAFTLGLKLARIGLLLDKSDLVGVGTALAQDSLEKSSK